MVSLALNGEYLKGQSIPDVSKFSSRPDIGIEDEPTINDDAGEEETIEEDETEPETTDEEDNETVTSVPPKRPTGIDLGLNNLTTAPLEEGPKLIFASCQIDFPSMRYPSEINKKAISCNVPGASPNDNVVVSSTALDIHSCQDIVSSRVSEPNVVTILLQRENDSTWGWDGSHNHNKAILDYSPPHRHTAFCDGSGQGVKGTVIFSIIVFRPEVPDIIGTLEELQDKTR